MKARAFALTISSVMIMTTMSRAHFGAIIPSDDMVTQSDPRTLNLSVMFFHPFEGDYMNMVKPAQFGVMAQGKKVDLLSTLKEKKVDSFSTWVTEYKIKRPGDHIFYVEPQPYFEPAEESFIVHYTKVIVNAMGMEEGWDEEIGLKTEIIPLTRPYGLWAGNVFQGVVKVNGEPAPGTEVEIEYYNEGGKVKAPADPLITQVVKADENGVFTYAMPKAGWWGFAALNTDTEQMEHDGKPYDVEIGAVLWVRTHPMK